MCASECVLPSFKTSMENTVMFLCAGLVTELLSPDVAIAYCSGDETAWYPIALCGICSASDTSRRDFTRL